MRHAAPSDRVDRTYLAFVLHLPRRNWAPNRTVQTSSTGFEGL